MNNEDTAGILSELELEILQEIMNIGFGRAAADLAEVIDIFISLSAPKITVIEAVNLIRYVNTEISELQTCSIVEQPYLGEAKGVAFLIFPHGAEKEFLSYFQDKDIDSLESDILIDLEKEVLMEVGNILIGACIGKIFELLDGLITFQPPRVIIGEKFTDHYIKGSFSEDDSVITMKTSFSFEDRDVHGYLFLVNRGESGVTLKKALNEFWEKQNAT